MSNNDPYTKEIDSRFTLHMPTKLLNIIWEKAKKINALLKNKLNLSLKNGLMNILSKNEYN